jgi:hypothetical protein
MLCAFVKCAMVLAKRPKFLLFSTAQVRNEYSPQLSKLLYNCKFEKQGSTLIYTLKGSQRMGGRRIFLNTFRATLLDLSNEPNFGQTILLDSTFNADQLKVDGNKK